MNIMAIFIFALIWAIGAAVVALVEYACGEPDPHDAAFIQQVL